MLKISNLQVSVEGKKIVKGVDLMVKPGEVQAIMGPNGSGKSTLAYALAGHPKYEIRSPSAPSSGSRDTKSEMSLDGKNLLGMTPDQRAKAGLFLAFQYPVSVEGVTVEQLLKKVVGKGVSALEFRNKLERAGEKLGVKRELLRRSLNEGFSGGEKKKLEILQLKILKPKYAILDETDSGLDIDALRAIASGIWHIANSNIGIILITHYQRLLQFIKPDVIHIMVNGRIVKSGGRDLAEELEKEGYKKYV